MTLRFAPERIELWPLERLSAYPRNPRTHSDEQVAQIAASMVEFGWTNPVLVSADGEVIAGHGRLEAARRLRLETVPVVVLDHLTPAQRRAYVIADNQIALNAGWNEALLAAEVARLEEDGGDLDLLGFGEDDLDRMLDGLDAGGAPEEEDDVPEPPAQAVTRPGDLWLLGPHRLLCGDATSAADLGCLMADARAHMCFTDSPYNVDYIGGPLAGGRRAERRIMNDALGKGFGRFLFDACSNIIAHTDGAIYMCMSSSELHTLQTAFTAAGGHWSTFIIWAKDRFTLGRSDYQRQYEVILYGWPEGKEHYWCGARDQGDVWLVDRPSRNDLHPTMKPVTLVERAIRNSSRRGSIILDPFAGSGTTLIACHDTNRHARLIELDPRYCDVILRRWQVHTGGKAMLADTGMSFDELGEVRSGGGRVASDAV
jgi:DNA modification methylase